MKPSLSRFRDFAITSVPWCYSSSMQPNFARTWNLVVENFKLVSFYIHHDLLIILCSIHQILETFVDDITSAQHRKEINDQLDVLMPRVDE